MGADAKAGNFLVILLGGLLASSRQSWAKPEYARKGKKTCVYCPLTAASKELREAGQYHPEHGDSFGGCRPKKAPARSD